MEGGGDPREVPAHGDNRLAAVRYTAAGAPKSTVAGTKWNSLRAEMNIPCIVCGGKGKEVNQPTWKRLFEDELVTEQQGESWRERLRLDVEAEEADGQGDRALARSKPKSKSKIKVTFRGSVKLESRQCC